MTSQKRYQEQRPPKKRSKRLSAMMQWGGLAAIALFTFHIVGTLLFAVLGLSPSSARWSLLLTFASVLAVAGLAVGVQGRLRQARLPSGSYASGSYGEAQTLAGTVSGIASGAILGFFIGGQLGNQQTLWAIIGLVIGGIGLGSWASWVHKKEALSAPQAGYGFAMFSRRAIALISGLCAYGLAFGLGAWSWMAVSTGHLGLAVVLGLLAGLYLWFTRQAIRLL